MTLDFGFREADCLEMQSRGDEEIAPGVKLEVITLHWADGKNVLMGEEVEEQ